MTHVADQHPRIFDRDVDTVTLRVPLVFVRRGGRKVVVAADGSAEAPAAWKPYIKVDNTMVKALARAFRWQRLLDCGDYGSITELADAEKLNRCYVSRVLRLTLLAPDIVEAILDGRHAANLTLAALLEPFPVGWDEQRREY